jgi:phage shock protein PspC (stress-responsive transcriptional regulator)
MDKTIVISLSGHPKPYRLHEDAYDRLAQYLDRAAARLDDDPDRAEVLGDLERSVGDKLAALLRPEDRLVTAADIDGVLEAIGAVDTGNDARRDESPPKPRARRLRRIREGQNIAGVCNGLAVYAELDVAWIRTGFVLGTLVTAGLLAIVYIALVFILPVVPNRRAYDLEIANL